MREEYLNGNLTYNAVNLIHWPGARWLRCDLEIHLEYPTFDVSGQRSKPGLVYLLSNIV